MSGSLRSILVLLAVFAAAANVQAAGKGRKPPARHARKAPARVSHPKTAAKGRKPAKHQARKAPSHVSHSKVSHHRRPAVHRRPVHSVRRTATRTTSRTASRTTRKPVRQRVVRTVHRYPVHRQQRRYVRRSSSSRRFSSRHRYTYSYYPGRYAWRRSSYNRGYGASRRSTSLGIGGIVESVQGNANNGTLVVKLLRPRHSRFRVAGRSATSLHRFQLNKNTRYEVLAAPPRGGTIADLHKGERVRILPHTNAARTAQKVSVSPQRKR
ncbi:MAG: hypothetical protein ACRELG_05330 [Gemmataceae bacterium]